MKFVSKELRNNVNVSSRNPLKEFFLLLGSLLGIVLVIYIGLGFAVDLIVPRLPVSIEKRLGKMFSSAYMAKKDQKYRTQEEELQRILNGLAQSIEIKHNYKVYIIPDKQANAFALPGANIIVTSALIEQIEMENELAFVLAHELGHFANRDHLRGLGRGLVLLAISTATFGADSSLSQVLQKSLKNTEMRFSQEQEKAADLFALKLLNATYGHVGGATGFFKTMAEKEKRKYLLYFFASHPYSQDRIDILEGEIDKNGYLIKQGVELNRVFKQGF